MPKAMPRSHIDNLMHSSSEVVRVYTLQNQDALTCALNTGYFTGSHPFSYLRAPEHEEIITTFQSAYEWMREQMAERIDSFSGDLPVWAWLKRPSGRQITDEGPLVRVTALVPRNRMLLSCFSAWHMPLGGSPLLQTESLWDIWYNLSPENRMDVKSTWDQVFDLKKRNAEEEEWMGQPDRIQACIDRLYISEIVDIRPMRRRGQSFEDFTQKHQKLFVTK